MSTLQFSLAVGVLGLEADQSAYTIDSGIYTGTLVRVEQTKQEIDYDNDGAPDQINYKTYAAIIDNTNTVQTSTAGIPYRTQAQVDGIVVAQVNAGNLNIGQIKADLKLAMIHKVLNLRTVIDAA